jgi:alkylation response protein AidB-like acyl-CoA dehydrogenase
MDFNLSREHEMLREMVKEFADRELAPRALELDSKGEFFWEQVSRSGQLGLIGVINSKEYGGTAMGHLARMIVIEEISRVYPPLGFYHQTGNLLMYAIEAFGNDQQKKKYLPALCRGEKVSAFALTEASGGSDSANMQTEATFDGEYYVVNGRKCWITAVDPAELVGLVAKTGDRFSAFIVEKGTPGFDVTRREETVGLRSLPVNEFALTNCRLPKENLIGDEGRGLTYALTTIATIGRTGAAGVALGIARGCYDTALKFAKQRILYGKPIAALQGIQFMLTDMNVEIEAAKWLCYSTAWRLDQGKTSRELAVDIARCKLYAVDVANRCAYKAVDIMGAYGLSPEYRAIGLLRDALELGVAAGSQEIMKVTIGAAITR